MIHARGIAVYVTAAAVLAATTCLVSLPQADAIQRLAAHVMERSLTVATNEAAADVNADGVVDVRDFQRLAAQADEQIPPKPDDSEQLPPAIVPGGVFFALVTDAGVPVAFARVLPLEASGSSVTEFANDVLPPERFCRSSVQPNAPPFLTLA